MLVQIKLRSNKRGEGGGRGSELASMAYGSSHLIAAA